MSNVKAIIALVVSGVTFVLLMTFIIVWVVKFQPDDVTEDIDDDYEKNPDSNFVVTYNEEEGLVITVYNDIRQTVLKTAMVMRRGKNTGFRIQNCAGWIANLEKPRNEMTCIELVGKAKYIIEPLKNNDISIECQSHSWTAIDCRTDMFEMCLNMSNAHWYGGATIREQLWPINHWKMDYMPYITGDVFKDEYGSVQERYWLSSNGVAIYVNWDVPLWVSFNQTDSSMCLKSQYKNSPYYNLDDTPVFMNYTICEGLDAKHVHQYMVNNYLGKPTGIPDEELFRYPIWSTWAQYFRNVNQTLVLDYAYNILQNNFTYAQLEIDDKWENGYGVLDFDLDKFPDPKAMVMELDRLGFRTTLWVHPFINYNVDKIWIAGARFALVTDPGGFLPGLVTWWNGVGAILDFTKNSTREWFQYQLQQLRDNYGISSFKFDAGEVNWLPAAYILSNPAPNPSFYSTAYANMAYEADSVTRNLEVRVGAQTQHLPVFVRMMDKLSTWGYDNGLKSLIPHALTFSIIGYPFILPDMIGGNGYDDIVPDKELFIRWVEANVFLPGFQFSILPWNFDEETVAISRSMVELHTKYSDVMIQLAEHCVETGDPIIRPLWWLDPYDQVALVIDSEFLLGDNILVAPILDEAARKRDIYLPEGSWEDKLRGDILQGSMWYYDYTVELHELAFFTRTENSQSNSAYSF